jgi:hypothetical protein
MESVIAFAAPLAFILPLVAEAMDRPAHTAPQSDTPTRQYDGASEVHSASAAINPLFAMRQSVVVRQVRIEQRVLVRIAPQPNGSRRNLTAELVPKRAAAPRFEEGDKEKCLALNSIAGVQTGNGNRLVLFLRDRRMISVNLEKACRARDFYAGFYVEKNKDGRLCVDRDKLQSRTGVSCEVETMRQLVAVRS